MDSFEFNKIVGAVLFAVLVLFGMRTVSNLLFAAHPPEKPGYEVEIAEADDAAGKGEEKKEEVSIAMLMQTADAEKGAKVFKKCAQCHSVEEGKAKPTGPTLYGVLGREKGTAEYAYSTAIKEKGGNWGYEQLDGFIAAPKKWLPGTKMAFAGIKRPNQRADLIAYLRSLSASPLPLPEAPAAEAKAEQPEAPAMAKTEQPAAAAEAKPEQPEAPAEAKSEQPETPAEAKTTQ